MQNLKVTVKVKVHEGDCDRSTSYVAGINIKKVPNKYPSTSLTPNSPFDLRTRYKKDSSSSASNNVSKGSYQDLDANLPQKE